MKPSPTRPHETIPLLEATNIIKFSAENKTGYDKRCLYEKAKLAEGATSAEKTYFLKQNNPLASFAYLIVSTGIYTRMADATFGSEQARKILDKIYPDRETNKDFIVYNTSNYAPKGYEITDYTEFNKLASEIKNNYYAIETVLDGTIKEAVDSHTLSDKESTNRSSKNSSTRSVRVFAIIGTVILLLRLA